MKRAVSQRCTVHVLRVDPARRNPHSIRACSVPERWLAAWEQAAHYLEPGRPISAGEVILMVRLVDAMRRSGLALVPAADRLRLEALRRDFVRLGPGHRFVVPTLGNGEGVRRGDR